MVFSKHFLGTVGQLLNGVGIVVHVLFEDRVALEHQHGALLILRRQKRKRMMTKNQDEEEEISAKKKKGARDKTSKRNKRL